ncbi:GGDEF domain-containing protein [Paracoccus sediminicola]|uniref:GGDEF domain-containing protein n=1 Tax=Paracoccus sediminicola TaxID=3017783 RepID=UPI0022F12079|nr:GGDEF domain-containing protein [Paracoccus sediminicola]WBU57521.1 GGDEF domain-containing protein [Paracoccus sediminicola]
MKARLGAANHQVRTAANVTEAVKSGAGINAVLLRNPDSAALTRDISALRRRMAVPVIAICDAAQRQAAFRAGAQHVLESDCHDSVLRARLRRWMTRRAPTEPGFAEPMADFQPPQQIALISSDAGLSSEWRCAVSRATGRGLLLLPPRALNGALPDDLAAVLIDAGPDGSGLQHLADLRARLNAEGRGSALALLQRRPLAEQEAQALDMGAADVMCGGLSRVELREELEARLTQLLRTGMEGERRFSDARMARHLACVDPLTGLDNRRRMNAEIAAADASGDRFALLMIDIDRFKAINDTHGHAAGDMVLSHVGTELREAVGSVGRVARYGGEEFVVLLSGADETVAVSLAERIRHRISARQVPVSGLSGEMGVAVSVSIGVAASGEQDEPAGTPSELMRMADAALISAKQAGRNLVMLWRTRDAA